MLNPFPIFSTLFTKPIPGTPVSSWWNLGACWVRQKPPGIIPLMGNPDSPNESTSENFALQSQGSPEQLLERQTLVCAKGRKTQPGCLTSRQPLCIRACIYACTDTCTNSSKKALENDACEANRNTFLSFFFPFHFVGHLEGPHI